MGRGGGNPKMLEPKCFGPAGLPFFDPEIRKRGEGRSTTKSRMRQGARLRAGGGIEYVGPGE